MTTLPLYYATNRNYTGDNRWQPSGYGKKFSDDGMENLRFGFLTADADDAIIASHIEKDMNEMGAGDGESLGAYLAKCATMAKIQAYEEKLNPELTDTAQKNSKLGSLTRFADLKMEMESCSDMAMVISDYTKGNPERLGSGGAARPSLLHNKVHQVDCTPVVSGIIEHSYYLCGRTNADICQSIDGMPYNDPQRRRSRDLTLPNVWKMR